VPSSAGPGRRLCNSGQSTADIEFVNQKAFWDTSRTITPEYRRITLSDDGGKNALTYVIDATQNKQWTIPVTRIGKEGDKDNGITAKSTQPDQWGYSRWVPFSPSPA
jgi:hypothetical protein